MSVSKKKYHSISEIAVFVVLCSIVALPLRAQNQNKEKSTAGCSVSRYITVPFVKDTGSLKNNQSSVIRQQITYAAQDEFSYWYKISFDAETIVNAQLSPINKADKYVAYIYRYKEADFCNKLYDGKVKPVRVENEQNRKSIIEASDSSDFSFKVKKGDVFYICVIGVSESNCGHVLRLINAKDTLKVNAAHTPCIGELKPKEPVVKVKELFKDSTSLFKPKINYDTIIVAVREVNKPGKKLKANLIISDVNTLKPAKIDSSKQAITTVLIEKGKKYQVTCDVTGYKKFNHVMNVAEYVNADSNTFLIYMKPLKAGDNFIMENIYFYPNTYALKDESQQALDNLLNYLLENPDVKIELQGHTNGNNKAKKSKSNKDKGPEWNFSGSAKKLSLLRAEEIKKYLVQKGVNKNNIRTVGFGGDKMIVPNPKSPEALKKNVRVEVVIIDDGGF